MIQTTKAESIESFDGQLIEQCGNCNIKEKPTLICDTFILNMLDFITQLNSLETVVTADCSAILMEKAAQNQQKKNKRWNNNQSVNILNVVNANILTITSTKIDKTTIATNERL